METECTRTQPITKKVDANPTRVCMKEQVNKVASMMQVWVEQPEMT